MGFFILGEFRRVLGDLILGTVFRDNWFFLGC